MAKPWNPYSKIRAAVRQVWRFSPARREALKLALQNGKFVCPCCKIEFDKWCADVDHVIPCGSFKSWGDSVGFLQRLFEGELRVICKGCHKKVTAEQRRKK
jgi:hypothetical protein